MGHGHVEVVGVSKRFQRGVLHDSLAELIATGTRVLLRRPARDRHSDDFHALQNVTFEVRSGEAVGMIGPNGAGKSTLLKLLAGILRADGGLIRTKGRVTALIEISAGFHGDLTGRENIYMNAAILGMRRREIDRKLDDIVNFSGLKDFLDTPVKRYSSGMQARLGFSVAAHVDPDVLLVDEVLSVGDALFRQRCVQRMRQLVNSGTALLFVTHHLEQMQSFCSRAVVLDQGRQVFDGETPAAVTHYLAALRSSNDPLGDLYCTSTAKIEDVRHFDSCGALRQVFHANEPMRFEVAFELSRPVERLSVEVDVRREIGALLANFNSIRDEVTFDAGAGHGRAILSLPSLPLGGGQYLVRVVLRDADSHRTLACSDFRHSLVVEDGGRATGILAIPHEWSYLPTDYHAKKESDVVTAA